MPLPVRALILYRRGATTETVGKQYGVSKEAVRKFIKKVNPAAIRTAAASKALRDRRIKGDMEEKIIEDLLDSAGLFPGTLTYTDIAKKYKLSSQNLFDFVRRNPALAKTLRSERHRSSNRRNVGILRDLASGMSKRQVRDKYGIDWKLMDKLRNPR